MSILSELLGSKKFVGALLTMGAAIAVRWGVPEVEIEELLALVSPMLAYIGAQGIADHGKSKAQVESAPQQLGDFSMPPITVENWPIGSDQAIIEAIQRHPHAVKEALGS